MVETTTQHYGWVNPEIAHSPSTWGGFLNTDLDSIDALVFANQQGLVPIGAIEMFGGATAPTNWLLCQGQSLTTAAPYDKLFAVLGYAHGGSGANFNLPDLRGKFPLGAGPSNALGSIGGSYTVTIALGNLPSHAHPITDVAHNHTLNQTAHNHGDPTHSHGVNEGSGHSHGIPQGAGLVSGVNLQPGSGFNLNTASRTTTDVTGLSIYAAYTGIQAANANVSLNASGTGLSTTQSVGSGTPLNVVPSFQALSFIIRYT